LASSLFRRRKKKMARPVIATTKIMAPMTIPAMEPPLRPLEEGGLEAEGMGVLVFCVTLALVVVNAEKVLWPARSGFQDVTSVASLPDQVEKTRS
jgi:hypothetical protein